MLSGSVNRQPSRLGLGHPAAFALPRGVYVLLALLLLAQGASATVCRLPRIGGLDAEYERSISVIGTAYASDLSSCKVYLLATKRGIYAHSNYRTTGFPNPTKIFTRSIKDLDTLTYNIIFSEKQFIEPAWYARDQYKITYYIDQSLIDSEGKLALKASAEHRLMIQDDGAWRRLVSVDDKSTSWTGVLRNRFHVNAASSRPQLVLDKLASLRFDKRRIQVINLVADSATQSELASASLGNRLVDASSWSADDIFLRISNSKESTIIVLSHIEDGNCTIVDRLGSKVATIPVADLQDAADRAGISLLLMGCHSSDLARLGTTHSINSYEFATCIVRALKAKNYYDFYHRLAGSDLFVLTPADFSNGRKLHTFRLGRAKQSLAKSEHRVPGYEIVLASMHSDRGEQFQDISVIGPVATIYMSHASMRDSRWPWMAGIVGAIIAIGAYTLLQRRKSTV